MILTLVSAWLAFGILGWLLLVNQLSMRLNHQQFGETDIIVPRRRMIAFGLFGLIDAIRAIRSLPREKRSWGLRLTIN